jgi:hypothetical protein
MIATRRNTETGEESPVSLLDREQKPIENDPHHDQMILRTQSVSERDLLMRVFPDPLPEGYRLAYKWVDLFCVLQVMKDPNYVAVANGKPDPTAELMKLSQPDLITMGAELGLALHARQSKPKMVGDILRARRERDELATAA